jgi:hypothetical protein
LDSESIVQNGINDLIDYFETHRDCFFNEHDLHHVFYGNLSNLGNLVRPEYPTRKRFFGKKKGYDKFINGTHSFPARGKNVPVNSYRGHYDFAVLNKEFYNEFKNQKDVRFERLSSKNVDTNWDRTDKYLDVAIEFKYIAGQFKSEYIDFDIFKLNEAEEAKKKIFLVFVRKRGMSDRRYNKIVDYLEDKKMGEKEIQMEIIL